MDISSDVNTIFAYCDSLHKYHKSVLSFMMRQKRSTYILLDKVKSHFIYTYKDYLSTCCIIIEQAIRDQRLERSKSPSKTYKPSAFAISSHVRSLVDKKLVELCENKNFDFIATKQFVDLILSEYSIPDLYENEKVLGEFRERYLVGSEKIATTIVNKFLRFFYKFEEINLNQYTHYNNWLDKIKDSKNNVFKNKQDYEDMTLAAEFLCYNQEIGILYFFGCDSNCCRSIEVVAKEYDLKIGKITLINLNLL